MEEYKLTKEEKEKIKKLEQFRKKARNQILSYMFGEILLTHMTHEESKKTDKSNKDPIERMISNMQGFDPEVLKEGKIKKELEKELKLCEEILYGDITNMIVNDPTNEKYDYLSKRLDRYVNKKLKPDVEEYSCLLKEAIDEHELQECQLKEFREKGHITSRGRTRPERLKKKDIENQDKMRRYNEAKDKTGLELPIAEGLNAKPGENVTSKEKPEQDPPIKRLDIKYLIKKTEGELNKVLIEKCIAEPGLVLKSYAICKNNDLQIYKDVIKYCNDKKLTTLSFSINDGERIFTYIKPKFTIYADFDGTLKIRDNETFRTTDFYQKQKK